MRLAMDRLFVSLLNTALERPDALETPVGAARWWAEARISVAGKPRFDPALARALRSTREALLAMVEGRDHALPLRFRGDSSDAIVFEILHAIRIAMNQGTLLRTRACAYQGCGRYFLDQTKNGSRRWCSLRCMERARAPRRRTISG